MKRARPTMREHCSEQLTIIVHVGLYRRTWAHCVTALYTAPFVHCRRTY